MGSWTVHFSEEVANWYATLSIKDRAIADRHIENLEQFGNRLGMPRSRNLKDKLYELRFKCQNVERRITYTIEPQQQIITLTTFRKQKDNERHEINRARKTLKGRQS